MENDQQVEALHSKKLSALHRQATVLGATAAELDRAIDDHESPKAALIALIQSRVPAELPPLSAGEEPGALLVQGQQHSTLPLVNHFPGTVTTPHDKYRMPPGQMTSFLPGTANVAEPIDGLEEQMLEVSPGVKLEVSGALQFRNG